VGSTARQRGSLAAFLHNPLLNTNFPQLQLLNISTITLPIPFYHHFSMNVYTQLGNYIFAPSRSERKHTKFGRIEGSDIIAKRILPSSRVL
jgi:hypothetical protein